MKLNSILKNIEYILLFIIVSVSAILVFFCIHDGHDWSGDYALYIEQTQAIFNGSIDTLYEVNKYSTDRAYRVQGPYLYPMGFPILLALPYSFFGMNFIALKLFCALFFLGALPLYFYLFKASFEQYFYALCIVIFIAFHIGYIAFCDNVLSDLPFFFFCALTFLQLQRSTTIVNQFLVGVLVFFTYYIRDVGIIFIPTLMVYQFQLLFLEKRKEKNYRYYLVPYFVFVFLYFLNDYFMPKGNSNHYDLLWNKLSFEMVIDNLVYYCELFSSVFFIKIELLLLLSIPLLLGIFANWKQHLHFIAFALLLLFIYIIWPAHQGVRFVFPIIPFMLYFIVKGFLFMVAYLRIHHRYLAVSFLLILIFLTYNSLQFVDLYSKRNSNVAYNADTKIMYAYILKQLPEKEIIGFEKPRILRLFTGRISILCNLSHFDASGLNYLLIRKKDIPDGFKVQYTKIFETNSLLLVRR